MNNKPTKQAPTPTTKSIYRVWVEPQETFDKGWEVEASSIEDAVGQWRRDDCDKPAGVSFDVEYLDDGDVYCVRVAVVWYSKSVPIPGPIHDVHMECRVSRSASWEISVVQRPPQPPAACRAEYIEVVCPKCDEEFAFKATRVSIELCRAACPECDEEFEFKLDAQ